MRRRWWRKLPEIGRRLAYSADPKRGTPCQADHFPRSPEPEAVSKWSTLTSYNHDHPTCFSDTLGLRACAVIKATERAHCLEPSTCISQNFLHCELASTSTLLLCTSSYAANIVETVGQRCCVFALRKSNQGLTLLVLVVQWAGAQPVPNIQGEGSRYGITLHECICKPNNIGAF